MPQVKGRDAQSLIKRSAPQPLLENQPTPFKKKRLPRGWIQKEPQVRKEENFVPSEPILTERDQAELRGFRRSLSLCTEGACMCHCNCHMGPICDHDDPKGFHFRTPNPAHKRTHRECPKGDHHKW